MKVQGNLLDNRDSRKRCYIRIGKQVAVNDSFRCRQLSPVTLDALIRNIPQILDTKAAAGSESKKVSA
jgi:hypothetical protein